MARFRPDWVMTLVAIPACALLVTLGVWQSGRYGEKQAAAAAIAAGLARPPAALESLLSDPGSAVYRPVHAQGAYRPEVTALVFAPLANGGSSKPGYRVLTVFSTSRGQTLFVERGWQAGSDPKAALRGLPPLDAGPTSIEGILKPRARSGPFTPAPDQAARLWYIADTEAMAKAQDLTLSTLLILHQKAGRGGEGLVTLPFDPALTNNHLGYALTWFGLAGALIALYLAWHHAQGRLRWG